MVIYCGRSCRKKNQTSIPEEKQGGNPMRKSAKTRKLAMKDGIVLIKGVDILFPFMLVWKPHVFTILFVAFCLWFVFLGKELSMKALPYLTKGVAVSRDLVTATAKFFGFIL